MIRLIALDLDGTLLTSDKRLSERNKAALSRAALAGIEIVPCTGRFYDAMPQVIRELPFVRYAITINGAQVIDLRTGRILYSAEIPFDMAVRVLSSLDSLPVVYNCYMADAAWITKDMQDRADEYIREEYMLKLVRSLFHPVDELKAFLLRQKEAAETGAAVRGMEELRKETQPFTLDASGVLTGARGVQKLMALTKDSGAREYMLQNIGKMFPEIIATSSVSSNVELNYIDADKGKALLALADALGIRRGETMAFGDGLNDVPMLRAAGIGVAMENGCREAMEAADASAPPCDLDGVAQTIEPLL